MARQPQTIGGSATDAIVGNIATRIAPRFGLTPTAVALAITTLIGVATSIHENVTRFDEGYNSAIENLRDGGIELDEITLKIKTEADQVAIDAWQEVLDAQGEYEEKQSDAVSVLESRVTYWKNRTRKIENDRSKDPETPWDDVPLPTHERLRFDKLNRERDSDGSADTRAATDSEPRAFGYPALANPERP